VATILLPSSNIWISSGNLGKPSVPNTRSYIFLFLSKVFPHTAELHSLLYLFEMGVSLLESFKPSYFTFYFFAGFSLTLQVLITAKSASDGSSVSS